MSTILARGSAMLLALILIALQIRAAIEYTEGGSTYTVLVTIGAVATLAALPALIEVAFGARARLIGVALLVGFFGLLLYTLPATIGRTGEVRTIRATEAARSAEDRVRDAAELRSATEARDDARARGKKACASAPAGDTCKAWGKRERAYQAQVEQIGAALRAEASPVKAGDLGSDSIAWALAGVGIQTTGADVRRASSVALGIGCEVLIWALTWLAFTPKLSRPATVSGVPIQLQANPRPVDLPRLDTKALPEPPKAKRRRRKRPIVKSERGERVVSWIEAYTAKHGQPPSFAMTRARFRLPKATAHRYRKSALG